MKTPEELSNEVDGLSLESAKRVIEGVKSMDAPLSREIGSVMSATGIFWSYWCGERSPGVVEIWTGSKDLVMDTLTSAGYELKYRGVYYYKQCETHAHVIEARKPTGPE